MARRRTHPAAAAIVLLALGLPSVAQAASTADPTTGRLLVTLDSDRRGPAAVAAAAGRLTSAVGARRAGRSVPALGVLTVRPLAGGSVAALAERLRAQPGVESVQAERRFTLRYVPNDPALSEPETTPGVPPGTPVQWWATRQNLPAAWDVTRGASARIAVIDTGIDATHPAFAGKIEDAIDLDGDPTHGPATRDEVGHGTHVASLACASGDDGISLVGAGFGCKLLVYKTDLSEGSVAKAITDATDRGVHAINMSFGTTGDRPVATAIDRAIRYAYDNDVVMAAAAADDPVQEQGDPANVLQPTGSGADITRGLGLSVTAANFNDQRATFAGLGSQISIAAYGAWNTGQGGPKGLLGAFPAQPTELERPTLGGSQGCGCRTSFAGDTRYAYVQGTSMAAPIVAATAALVRDLNPDLAAADVIRLLKQTARRAPGATWEPNLGWGILDAGAALNAARALDRRAPTTRVTAPRRPRSTTFALRLTVRDTAPRGVVASGVRRVELFRSIDGRKATRIARLTVPPKRTSFRVRVRRGARYAFYAVGIDAAGNREPAPLKPDTRVRLAPL